MIAHPRTAILYYASDLVAANTDVGGRVYLHRPTNLDIYELPAVCIFFSGEQILPFTGGSQIPDEYLRSAAINIDVFAENPNDPDNIFRVEEFLNSLCRQIELALFDDIFFSKRLPSYTGSLSDPGLLSSISLASVEPYEIDSGEHILMCQRMTFNFSYIDLMFSEKKTSEIESYLVEIRRVGWDEDTVDPVLTAAEGDFDD